MDMARFLHQLRVGIACLAVLMLKLCACKEGVHYVESFGQEVAPANSTVVLKEVEASSRIQCGIQCSSDEGNCRSFDFEEKTGRCELRLYPYNQPDNSPDAKQVQHHYEAGKPGKDVVYL